MVPAGSKVIYLDQYSVHGDKEGEVLLHGDALLNVTKIITQDNLLQIHVTYTSKAELAQLKAEEEKEDNTIEHIKCIECYSICSFYGINAPRCQDCRQWGYGDI